MEHPHLWINLVTGTPSTVCTSPWLLPHPSECFGSTIAITFRSRGLSSLSYRLGANYVHRPLTAMSEWAGQKRSGDAIEEGGWGHRRCGGMYGVSSRWSLSGAVGWTYSVGDTDAWRCPLTERVPVTKFIQRWGCSIRHLSSLYYMMWEVPN